MTDLLGRSYQQYHVQPAMVVCNENMTTLMLHITIDITHLFHFSRLARLSTNNYIHQKNV